MSTASSSSTPSRVVQKATDSDDIEWGGEMATSTIPPGDGGVGTGSGDADTKETVDDDNKKDETHRPPSNLPRPWSFLASQSSSGDEFPSRRRSISSTMENFLYHSSGDCEGPTTDGTRRDRIMSGTDWTALDGSLGSIFETSFDVTEERLRRLFTMFDKDHDGKISYETMRKGLDYHSGLEFNLDDESFLNLIRHLDLDKSGDITYEEFSEGIRLLMLRSLFRTVVNAKADDSVITEVFDYNEQRLVRRIVEGYGQQQVDASTSVLPISVQDFFFVDRPSWIAVRWINITGERASNVMKMTALKYRLHPLALEDALEAEQQRPKAESYGSHYIALIPIFYLEWDDDHDDGSGPTKNPGRPGMDKATDHTRRFWDRWPFRGTRYARTPKHEDDGRRSCEGRITRIGVQMTSMFVTMPDFNTVITFNNQRDHKDVRKKATDISHSSSLRNCWDRVQAVLQKPYSKLRQYNAQYLAYSLLDQAVDIIGPIVTEIQKAVKEEKEDLLMRKYKDLDYIHVLRDELKSMNRKFKPFIRLLVHVIEDDTISGGGNKIDVYLRDVLDNLENYDEEVKHLITLCEATDEEAEKYQRRQMDSTLYTLSVMFATFLPGQFLSGVWG